MAEHCGNRTQRPGHRRIATEEEMKRHVLAWETDRNERREKVVWRFQTADARIKLKHLYPEFA
jgi:hypothetical protein